MSLVKVKRDRRVVPKLSNDFFDADFFGAPGILDFDGGLPSLGLFTYIPAVNIIENNKDFKIELVAPGLEKKNFNIETDNQILTISFDKKEEKNKDNENYRRQEFTQQSFKRSFQLPENSLPNKIEAKYKDGILELNLPKKEASTPHQKKEIKID